MSEAYFRFFLIRSLIKNYRLIYSLEFTSTSLLTRKFFSCLSCWQMKQDIVNSFFINDFLLMTRLCDQLTLFLTEKYYILSIWEVLPSLIVTISISFLSGENAFMTFCCQPNILLKVVIQMIRLSHISLWKTMGKVAKNLVMVTSYCDFHFKCSNTSFSENKLIMDLNWNCRDCSIEKNKRKVLWFSADWYGRISHWWKKTIDDKTWLHLVSFANSL